MERIFAEAARLGVTIELGPVAGNERGRYYDDKRLIHIRPGLSVKQMQETCWHELAHAHYHDTTCHPAIEARANRRAALMAVDPEEYGRLERVSDDVGFIAAEMGLPTRVIRLWRQIWEPTPVRQVS